VTEEYNSNIGDEKNTLVYFKKFLFFIFQLLGCIVIGYMAWVLATSVTVSKFVDGSMVSRSTDIQT
jgi:hypothetical protein